MITKEQVWKGLKLEITADEIRKIYQADEYEEYDYYDFDLLMGTLYKVLNKEVDFETFITWCVLITNSFNYTKSPYRTKLSKLYRDVGYFFDGVAFNEQYDRKEMLEAIARLKYFDFLIKKVKNKTKDAFTSNGVERILCFDHGNWNYNSCVYKLIIKDYNTKEWEIRFVDDHDFEYDENINYSFVDEKDFDKIFHKFYNESENWKEIHNMNF